MMNLTLSALANWWANHVQKTMGGILVVLASADVGTLLLYQKDVAHFIGDARAATAMAAGKIVIGAAVFWRAVQAKVTPK